MFVDVTTNLNTIITVTNLRNRGFFINLSCSNFFAVHNLCTSHGILINTSNKTSVYPGLDSSNNFQPIYFPPPYNMINITSSYKISKFLYLSNDHIHISFFNDNTIDIKCLHLINTSFYSFSNNTLSLIKSF